MLAFFSLVGLVIIIIILMAYCAIKFISWFYVAIVVVALLLVIIPEFVKKYRENCKKRGKKKAIDRNAAFRERQKQKNT